jgi:DNA-directed RNA polymerase omega subunit
MEKVVLEELMNLLGNKYLAANIASQRARQLNAGMRVTIKTNSLKHPSIALEELVAGKLWYKPLPGGTKLDRALYPNREVDEEIDQEFRNQVRFISRREEQEMDKASQVTEDTNE